MTATYLVSLMVQSCKAGAPCELLGRVPNTGRPVQGTTDGGPHI